VEKREERLHDHAQPTHDEQNAPKDRVVSKETRNKLDGLYDDLFHLLSFRLSPY
jgi:regulator of replication initiation timing